MNEWKKYITAGNQFFSSNHYAEAKLAYDKAKQHAEDLFPKWQDADEAASALVISYHNIADLHQKQGDYVLARKMFEKVHMTILEALIATSIKSVRHASLMRACVETYTALITHKSCFPTAHYH